MSTLAAVISGWLSLFRFTTVRQFTKVGLFTTGALLAGLAIYAVEKYALRLEQRFVENPTDVMVRAFGISHFLVGWLYLLTSPRLWRPAGLARLLATIALGVVFCLAFAQGGAMRNPYLAMLFFGYFLVHEIRDETRLYGQYEGHTDPSSDALAALSRAMLLLSMTLVVWSFLVYAATQSRTNFLALASPTVLGMVIVGLLAATAASLCRLVCLARGEAGTLRAFLSAHQPLLVVYAWLLMVLVAGSLLGTTGLNLVIMIHVSAWIFFTSHQLGRRPPKVGGNPWRWLRGTPAGFLTLHLGLLVGVLLLLAVRVHVWQKVGLASLLLASDSFCYWSIMHITISFWSSK